MPSTATACPVSISACRAGYGLPVRDVPLTASAVRTCGRDQGERCCMASDDAGSSGVGFTSAGATKVMAAACQPAGLSSDGAELIRFGENALFRLAAHPVIVRVARSIDYLESVRNEVQVSRWLAREGMPAARVLDDVEQPVIVDRCPVTFWHLIEEGDRKATYQELGDALRDLHSLTLPDGLELPPLHRLRPDGPPCRAGRRDIRGRPGVPAEAWTGTEGPAGRLAL